MESSSSKNIESKEMQTCYEDYFWDNGSKLLVHNSNENKHRTYTCPKLLPPYFNITVKFAHLHSGGHITIGVTDKIINEGSSKYLGGDYGAGNWGVSGSGTLGEGGKWGSTKCIYKEGDTLTLYGNNGVITFAVNGVLHKDYSYNVGSSKLFLAVTLYYQGDQIEIYQETL